MQAMGKKNRINCRKCRHYFVTWIAAQPHGCHAMGFRSSRLPNAVVLQNSGNQCRAFNPIKNNAHTNIKSAKKSFH
jgi:hypothetical protein